MGFLNQIMEWTDALYQSKVLKMQAEGKCPDCRGHGLNHAVISEHMGYFSEDFYKCQSCNGSGLFSDWEANANEQIHE